MFIYELVKIEISAIERYSYFLCQTSISLASFISVNSHFPHVRIESIKDTMVFILQMSMDQFTTYAKYEFDLRRHGQQGSIKLVL